MNAPARASLGCLLCLSTLACSVESAEGMTSLTGSSSAGSFTGMGEDESSANSSTMDDSSDSSTVGGTDDTSDTGASSDDTGADANTGDGDGDGDGDVSSGDGVTETGATTGSGGPLDPDLDVPPESNTACDTPGSLNECPATEVCRFYDTQSGRCESCDTCGNLNAFCNEGTDCDIVFACYQNTCTNFCTLGTSECGAINDCVDVGHPTRGVCAP